MISHRWINPPTPPRPTVVTEPRERRTLVIEIALVFSITLGLSGLRSLLSLLDAALRPESLSEQQTVLNAPQATLDLLDFGKQLLNVVQHIGWGGLGLYLIWRGGMRLAEIGLNRDHRARDLARGAALTAAIGIPGLLFYLVTWQWGLSLAVQPSTLDDTWWEPITLTLAAFGHAFAEEILVVGYLITRLRQLGARENLSLIVSAFIRASYHLYQGLGGFMGNMVMGLIFGRLWQRTNRLWPLIVAHTLLDVVAFLGYALLGEHISWLP